MWNHKEDKNKQTKRNSKNQPNNETNKSHGFQKKFGRKTES